MSRFSTPPSKFGAKPSPATARTKLRDTLLDSDDDDSKAAAKPATSRAAAFLSQPYSPHPMPGRRTPARAPVPAAAGAGMGAATASNPPIRRTMGSAVTSPPSRRATAAIRDIFYSDDESDTEPTIPKLRALHSAAAAKTRKAMYSDSDDEKDKPEQKTLPNQLGSGTDEAADSSEESSSGEGLEFQFEAAPITVAAAANTKTAAVGGRSAAATALTTAVASDAKTAATETGSANAKERAVTDAVAAVGASRTAGMILPLVAAALPMALTDAKQNTGAVVAGPPAELQAKFSSTDIAELVATVLPLVVTALPAAMKDPKQNVAGAMVAAPSADVKAKFSPTDIAALVKIMLPLIIAALPGAKQSIGTVAIAPAGDALATFSPTEMILYQMMLPLLSKNVENHRAEQMTSYINSHIQLEIFYTHFVSKLDSIFTVFKALSTNEVQHTSTAKDVIEGVSGGLTFVTLGISAFVGKIISGLHSKHKTSKAADLASFLGLSGDEIKFGGQHIALNFQWIIAQTTEKGAQSLAECAVACILNGLMNKQIKPHARTAEGTLIRLGKQFLESVLYPRDTSKLGFFKTTAIETQAGKAKGLTGEGILFRSGAMVLSRDPFTMSNMLVIPQGTRFYVRPTSRPDKYGFIIVTHEEITEHPEWSETLLTERTPAKLDTAAANAPASQTKAMVFSFSPVSSRGRTASVPAAADAKAGKKQGHSRLKESVVNGSGIQAALAADVRAAAAADESPSAASTKSAPLSQSGQLFLKVATSPVNGAADMTPSTGGPAASGSPSPQS